ncbi:MULTISPECIES: nucleotidyltransferase [unclassified Parvimonas]|uniref:nucleotidyltransferase n=1 Tax=unclassified Parvimonas TaxID=1151464 RepID=UPI002B468C8D|nr:MULTISPECIES: nucleotidyltransferase [unclassified Parvimonas]MEB3024722.1 nucleotidyltransferase [Parvimonas sp. M13]MEB3088867.1 nucleotidyltransferase [Parvimonas sp. M20]
MMYDLSSKFNTFYNSYVVLSQEAQSNLYNKKELNIQRLKDGLKEYNEENKTYYSIKETCVQGSVAMSTVVQNEDDDYDIDVAIVFDKSELGDKGAQATRNMVADALKRRTKQFNTEPEVKTSCVRVNYVDGYHVDFAIYRREYNEWNDSWVYEHAGADWTERELNGLSEWFITQNSNSGGKLRKILRLSKMFCKSRKSWKNMPSGLLQTVLCEEKLEDSYERIDELFYYTMKAIVERLGVNTCVTAPVDNGRDLTSRKSDIQRMINWKNRLKSKLEDLEILFKDDCSKADAIQAWYGFFNHDYWSEQSTEIAEYESKTVLRTICSFADTEEYIEELYPLSLSYRCKVSCIVSGNGWRPKLLTEFLSILRHYLPHNFEIRCTMDYTDCPQPYKIFWKVKNVGPEAERRNQIRGQIVEKGKTIVEHSNFYGNHYIECYIIKNNMCVAKERINIPIGRV